MIVSGAWVASAVAAAQSNPSAAQNAGNDYACPWSWGKSIPNLNSPGG